MEVSEKERAPAVRAHPGTRPTEKGRVTVDGANVRAGDPFFYAASRRLNGEQRDLEQRRNCFYCLEG